MNGHISNRGSTWSVVIEVGRDAEGKRRQKWHSGFKTKREAERARARLVNEVNTGTYVEPSKLRVAQFLERWLADYAKNNVAPKTYETYEEFVRVHLAPALGHLLLTKLQPLHIQSYYTKAVESGRRDGKGGLAPQTVLHHHNLLHKALKQAVKWQLLARNPCEAVEPPRARQAERSVLGMEEVKQLLTAAEDHWLYLPILLAVTTGMRRGEILGLQWEDVDLKAGVLSVRQALGHTKLGGLSLQAPKTQKSRRRILIPDMLVDALRRHKARQAEVRLRLGSGYEDRGLVNARETGAPRTPDNLSHAFPKLVASAGLPKVSFHDLRHTHATLLLADGINLKVVSERLGHSRAGITLDIYSHLVPGMQESAAQKIDQLFGEQPGREQKWGGANAS